MQSKLYFIDIIWVYYAYPPHCFTLQLFGIVLLRFVMLIKLYGQLCVCTCFNFLGNFWRQWPMHVTCIEQGNWGSEREDEKSKNSKRIPLRVEQDAQASAKLIEVKRCEMLLPAACCVCCSCYVCVLLFGWKNIFGTFFYDVHSIIIVIIITIITDWKHFHFFFSRIEGVNSFGLFIIFGHLYDSGTVK